MSEHSKIEAAAPVERAEASRRLGTSVAWGQEFAGSEHPDTARHRIQREYIAAVTALSREALDKKYAYLTGLIGRAKEELAHARSASNEVRMAAMQQNVDELISYLAGHGIHAKLPNRNGGSAASGVTFFALEEVPGFLGELCFLIDLWYENELTKVHDELLRLTGLAVRVK